jgi:hypothetical protein
MFYQSPTTFLQLIFLVHHLVDRSRLIASRVARWYIFQTKNPNLGKFWYILWSFGISYDHLVHSVVLWYIFTVLVCCTEKNLATLIAS